MRKERVNNSKNNTRFTNDKQADLELKVTSGSFSRTLKYTINKSENILKELPPSPPNSCILGKENTGGVASAIECALVTNSTDDNCQPGSRYQNLNVSGNGSNVLSGITLQGPVGSVVTIELTNPNATTFPNVFITGPGLDKNDLLQNQKVEHTISLDGRDLLILEATQQAYLRGDINADGSVNITDIMMIVYHIMQEDSVGALNSEEKDRAIYVNKGIKNLPESKMEDINLNTLMGVVEIALAF